MVNESEIVLVEAVRKYKALYDKTCKDYDRKDVQKTVEMQWQTKLNKKPPGFNNFRCTVNQKLIRFCSDLSLISVHKISLFILLSCIAIYKLVSSVAMHGYLHYSCISVSCCKYLQLCRYPNSMEKLKKQT